MTRASPSRSAAAGGVEPAGCSRAHHLDAGGVDCSDGTSPSRSSREGAVELDVRQRWRGRFRFDVDAIKGAIDLVQYVARFVALKRSGRGFLGLCPFHQEKTPSFRVDSERGWFCHGCVSGGDLIAFAMRLHDLSFVEAATMLAHEAGLSLDAPLDPATRRRIDEQARARRARDTAVRELRCTWLERARQLDDARERAFIAEAALKLDPQRYASITNGILAQYGDAIRERTRLEGELEKLDERERELRDASRRAGEVA